MKNKFTITVLDELYVDSMSANNTLTLTYDGPVEVWGKVGGGDRVFYLADSASEETLEKIAINANTNPAAAYLLTTPQDTTSYQFVDEELPDGTVYQKIVNPQLHDYFQVVAVRTLDEESNTNVVTGVSLCPIIRDPRTPGLLRAENMLNTIVNRLEVPVITDTEETTADLLAFKQIVEEFIAQELPKKAWKYVEFEQAPEVPESLTHIVGK